MAGNEIVEEATARQIFCAFFLFLRNRDHLFSDLHITSKNICKATYLVHFFSEFRKKRYLKTMAVLEEHPEGTLMITSTLSQGRVNEKSLIEINWTCSSKLLRCQAPTGHQNFESTDELCAICMERNANFQLLPCDHSCFCRECVVNLICSWNRIDAPSCPICRTAFHTLVLVDSKNPLCSETVSKC
jgi:hypothetical protein